MLKAIQLKAQYNIPIRNLLLGRGVYESASLDPLCQAVEQAWKARPSSKPSTTFLLGISCWGAASMRAPRSIRSAKPSSRHGRHALWLWWPPATTVGAIPSGTTATAHSPPRGLIYLRPYLCMMDHVTGRPWNFTPTP